MLFRFSRCLRVTINFNVRRVFSFRVRGCFSRLYVKYLEGSREKVYYIRKAEQLST